MTYAGLALAALLALQEDALDRVRSLARAGRIDDAIALLESRSRTEPRAEELAYLAQLYAGTGGVPQAVSALRRALGLAPEQDGLRVTLGAMLYQLRQFEEARSELELAVARNGRSYLAHYYLAAVERGLVRLDLAERHAERAIALSPPPARAPLAAREPAPSVAARHLLAEIRFEQGKEMELILRGVLAVEPDLASSRYLLARALQRGGRPEEAREEFRRFDALKRADAHLAQGLDLSRLGRREEAIAELKRAVEAGPGYAKAHFLLGQELLLAARREEARGVLDRALVLRPGAESEVAALLASFP